jgi:hypothetical protein
VSAFVQDNLAPIVLVLAGAGAIMLAGLAVQARRVAELRRRLDVLTRGDDGRSLQAVLESELGRLDAMSAEVNRLTGRADALTQSGRKAFQRIGLVRFNPFEDTGGNQSFALALLDAEDDGIIVSSLHARGGTRIYAKAIAGGRPEAALSDEESSALALARGATAGRVALAERTLGDRSTPAPARR